MLNHCILHSYCRYNRIINRSLFILTYPYPNNCLIIPMRIYHFSTLCLIVIGIHWAAIPWFFIYSIKNCSNEDKDKVWLETPKWKIMIEEKLYRSFRKKRNMLQISWYLSWFSNRFKQDSWSSPPFHLSNHFPDIY